MKTAFVIEMHHDDTCPWCKKPLKTGEKAVRVHAKRRWGLEIDYYHEPCYATKSQLALERWKANREV